MSITTVLTYSPALNLNSFKDNPDGLDWILGQLHYEGEPYHMGGESGIILDPAFDLGREESVLFRQTYSSILSSEQMGALEKTLGRRGKDADSHLDVLYDSSWWIFPLTPITPISISQTQSEDLFKNIIASYYWVKLTSVENFARLTDADTPSSVQTAMLAFAYDVGVVEKILQPFGSHIAAGEWDEVARLILNNYPRRGGNSESIRVRRQKQAFLILNDLSDNPLTISDSVGFLGNNSAIPGNPDVEFIRERLVIRGFDRITDSDPDGITLVTTCDSNNQQDMLSQSIKLFQAITHGYCELKDFTLSADLLEGVSGLVSGYKNELYAAFDDYEINNHLRVCHAMAQFRHESGLEFDNVEGFNYSAAALAQTYTAFQDIHTSPNWRNQFSTLTGNFSQGTYSNIPLIGGSGTGAVITVNVDNNSRISSAAVTNTGNGYLNGDIVSINAGQLGPGSSAVSVTLTRSTTEGAHKASQWGRPAGAPIQPGVGAANQQNIANWSMYEIIGNGDFASGDGWRYRGRGLIQLTGRSNYVNYNGTGGTSASAGANLVNNPDDAITATNSCRSASQYWYNHNFNDWADEDDGSTRNVDADAINSVLYRITEVINAGRLGLIERNNYFSIYKTNLKYYFDVNGCIYPGSETNLWLLANNGPRWVVSSMEGFGFSNHTRANEEDNIFCTEWLDDIINLAANLYFKNYLSCNDASEIVTEHYSPPTGGNDGIHDLGYQTGLDVSIRLPKTDGTSGGITVLDSTYDRNAMVAMLTSFNQAFAEYGITGRIYLNDEQLGLDFVETQDGDDYDAEDICDDHVRITIGVPERGN